jgi:hypothetical protein
MKNYAGYHLSCPGLAISWCRVRRRHGLCAAPLRCPPRGETPKVRALAALCAKRAVDQEAVCPVQDSDLLIKAYLL